MASDPFHHVVVPDRRGRAGWGMPARNGRGSADGPRGARQRASATLRAVRDTARGLPRVLGLVWGASPAFTLGLAIVTVLSGIVPATQAYTAKLLINAVVEAIGIHARHEPDRAMLAVPILWGTLRTPGMTTTAVVVFLAAVQFAILTASALLRTLGNICQQLLQERVGMRVQLLIMGRASTLDLAFFEDATSYDLLQQAQREAMSRPVTMVSNTFGLVRTALTFLSMIALLVGLSPWLAIVALVAPVPSFISDWRYGWQGYAIARWNSPLRRRMAYLLQVLTTDTYAKEVKLFNLGRYFIEQFRRLAQSYYDQQKGVVSRRYLAGFAWGTLTTLAGSGTYLYVALQAVAGRLTLGDLTLYTQAATQAQGAFQGLLSGLSSLYEQHLYLTSLYELLEVQPRIRAPGRPVPVPRPLRGAIEFDRVTFRYEGSERDVLREVSFTIKPGETIAVVGRNGAGKTTLIKLLCRLYDPTQGRVLLDGRDVRDYDPDDLHQQIGIMVQDFATYQATARENVGLGRVERVDDMESVMRAAEQSGADEVIAGLPKRYDTMLGKWFNEGVNLSGGEWQKVALGRAFMRDAPILILDEPTAALDAQAEFELFRRLRALTSGHTAIFISHRFSTVRLADRILVLEHGELVEQGTHDELMALEGRYARLFTLQASAYLGTGPGADVLARMADELVSGADWRDARDDRRTVG